MAPAHVLDLAEAERRMDPRDRGEMADDPDRKLMRSQAHRTPAGTARLLQKVGNLYVAAAGAGSTGGRKSAPASECHVDE
jgi:hypothetical protein